MTTTWPSVDADVIKAVDAVIDRTIRPRAAAVDSDVRVPGARPWPTLPEKGSA